MIFICLYGLLNLFINHINKNDTQEIKDRYMVRLIISLVSSIFIGLLYVKYSLSFNFFKYTVLMIYLVATGYIDAYLKMVYAFISHIFLVAGIIFFIVNLTNYNWYPGYMMFYLIGAFGSLILTSIAAFLKIFNFGDVEVFSIAALYIGGLTSILNIFCTFTTATVISLLLFIFKKINLKEQEAFCPYIAISTYLLLIFIL